MYTMKTSTSQTTFHPRNNTSFSNRKKLISLKNVIRRPLYVKEQEQSAKVLLKLEKALQNQYKESSQLLNEPQNKIPGFEEMAIEQKLWGYLQARMQTVSNKVEKQQVNMCERQFQQIKELVKKRRAAHQYSLKTSQKIMKDKYRQIHERFQEIKQEKITNKTLSLHTHAKKSSEAPIMPPQNVSQKLVTLKEDIEYTRSQIRKLERQYKLEEQQLEKLLKEWKSLLLNMLNHGYVMKKGVRPIFKQLLLIEYVPGKKDFPKEIDQTTYRCFMKVYNEVKQEEKQARQADKHEKTKTRHVSAPRQNIRQIAKQPKLKNIYQQTRNYMADYLRNQSWKQQCQLPKIRQRKIKSEAVQHDWQTEQRKRMCHVYEDREVNRKIKNMLFGPKVQNFN